MAVAPVPPLPPPPPITGPTGPVERPSTNLPPYVDSGQANAPPGSYPEAEAIQKKIDEERSKPGGGDPAVIKDLLKQLDDYFNNYNK